MNYRAYFARRAAFFGLGLLLALICVALSEYYAPENLDDPCEGLPPVYGTDC